VWPVSLLDEKGEKEDETILSKKSAFFKKEAERERKTLEVSGLFK
jgi:hypothetical protein